MTAGRRVAAVAALLTAAALTVSGCSSTSGDGGSAAGGKAGGGTVTGPPSTGSPSTGQNDVLGPSAASAQSAVPAGSHLAPAAFAAAAGAAGTVVLDVRTPGEFAAGHLPGAVNVDVESPDFAAGMAGRDPAATYAVYCHSGRRSAVALGQLAGLGFTRAYDLAGGIAAWTASGGEVAAGP